jgi:prepilin-type N-terminal cleavage/methylation domain-containing protein
MKKIILLEKNKAFTLIELLVVVAIIGILAASGVACVIMALLASA